MSMWESKSIQKVHVFIVFIPNCSAACVCFVIFLSRGQVWDLWFVAIADEVNHSSFTAGSTLLLQYISLSGCTAAFCPCLVCWQEVALGGWYLPQTVTRSQSEQGQADFRRFTERKNMLRKNEAFTLKDGYQQVFVVGEKPAGFLPFIWWMGAWVHWSCCHLESDELSRQDKQLVHKILY